MLRLGQLTVTVCSRGKCLLLLTTSMDNFRMGNSAGRELCPLVTCDLMPGSDTASSWDKGLGWVCVGVCVCVCVCEGGGGGLNVCACVKRERKREKECVCMCVRARAFLRSCMRVCARTHNTNGITTRRSQASS